jgi:YesN/AraC family two-component response regulator
MQGISGIELARKARNLQPNIHIVIISGYGEFEFAQGAIQASVDNYLLKPVSIKTLISVLKSIKNQLDDESIKLMASLLSHIASGQNYDEASAKRFFGRNSFRFAFVRWGNLDMLLPRKLRASTLITPQDGQFWELCGRDEDERILIAQDEGIDLFLTNLSVYMTRRGNIPTWTAVYTQRTQSIESLSGFVDWSIQLLFQKTIVGKHQILQYMGGDLNPEIIRLSAVELTQLTHFVAFENRKAIKDFLSGLATKWEQEQTPQWQVWHIVMQIIHHVATIDHEVYNRIEEIFREFELTMKNTGSYTNLAKEVYGLLFEQENFLDKKLSTQELYDHAIRFISENYTRPIGVKEVCDAVGISDSYMSRLFRRYSEVTFNSYLTQCRMEAAKKLIREKPDLMLRDIASCVGYEDSSYFSKVFKQYTGETPSQYANKKKTQ